MSLRGDVPQPDGPVRTSRRQISGRLARKSTPRYRPCARAVSAGCHPGRATRWRHSKRCKSPGRPEATVSSAKLRTAVVAGFPSLLSQAHVRGVEQTAGTVCLCGREIRLVDGDLSLRRPFDSAACAIPFCQSASRHFQVTPANPARKASTSPPSDRQPRGSGGTTPHRSVGLMRRAWIGSSSRKRCKSPASAAAVG